MVEVEVIRRLKNQLTYYLRDKRIMRLTMMSKERERKARRAWKTSCKQIEEAGSMDHDAAALPDPEEVERLDAYANIKTDEVETLQMENADLKQQRDALRAEVQRVTGQFAECFKERDELASALRRVQQWFKYPKMDDRPTEVIKAALARAGGAP
jgi:cell division septum initiation protein DivIVA